MILYLLTLLIAVIAQAENNNPSILTFEQFKAKYQLHYDPAEEDYRKQIFDSNVTQLINHPCDWCGVTKYFASTQAEIECTPVPTKQIGSFFCR